MSTSDMKRCSGTWRWSGWPAITTAAWKMRASSTIARRWAASAWPVGEKYQRVRLVIDNVSAGRIADVNRGILMPIKSAADEFSFTLAIDVTCPEGLDQSTLENKIKETIRQIGASLREEPLG